VAIVSLKDD